MGVKSIEFYKLKSIQTLISMIEIKKKKVNKNIYISTFNV